jgi:formylglycine-generating enzyme required for sulfatase activity
VTTEAGETYAEVAHEAIFRRWDKLKEWIAAERKFLSWRSGVEIARRAWEKTPDWNKNDALLTGFAKALAESWLARRSDDIPIPDQKFIVLSRDAAGQRRRRIAVLVAAVALGVATWWRQDWLAEQVYALGHSTFHPEERESELKPGDSFVDCLGCPEMVVLPAGHFMMGAREGEGDERPRHQVVIARPFAVGRVAVTFYSWDICTHYGACPRVQHWQNEDDPMVNVTWEDAQTYATWLSRVTGKSYRLLSEAEYEYATRAGTETKYPWGDEVESDRDTILNCYGCDQQPFGWAPVGFHGSNGFGLDEMACEAERLTTRDMTGTSSN